MQKLLEKHYNKILRLLDGINNNIPIIHSLIEGKSKGFIYVDDVDNPQSAFLYPENSFFYIVGKETNENFNKKIYDLIFDELVVDSEMVLFPLSDNWINKLSELFKEKKAIIIDRKNYKFNQSFYSTKEIKLPDNLLIKQVDENIAKELKVDNSWKSIHEFLNNGIGYVILNNNEVVSACYSIFVGKNQAEVDIFTKDEYQGKGYAKMVAGKFIQECVNQGLTPSWTCWPFREASMALANKLGFEEVEDIKAFFWAPNM